MSSQRVCVGFLLVALLLTLTIGPASALQAPSTSGPVRLSLDQATAAAVNELAPTANGYRLQHPRHTVTFAPGGLAFGPQNGAPAWAWRLTAVTASGSPLAGVEMGAVRPVSTDPLVVAYLRGGLVEQYLAKENTIEQQFLIPRPLSLGGTDLVIEGTVDANGEFEETDDGWLWRTGARSVRLGQVLVYDARGAILPATMAVTASSTHIAVDGAALAQASYPVTVDPEIGYDRVLSSMGPYTNPDYDALNPAVAYNSRDNEYLVVWSGADDIVGEYEIWGQRVNAADGTQIGADFQISFVGPADDPDYDAEDPDVAFCSATNEFVVVWSADHYTEGEFEIFGRRVGTDGALLGSMFRVSVMGGSADPAYDAFDPAIAYNNIDSLYIVVWEGDDTSGTLVDDEFEIWAKRISATGEWVDADELRMSDMGGSGNASYDARDPDVAHNSTLNQYLIVWEGDDTAPGLANDEFEIWGQRVYGNLGGVGDNDFRISWVGPDGDAAYDGLDPAIAYNSLNNQYLVVWEGEDLAVDAYDVYGRRLAADGSLLGSDRTRLSNAGVGPNNAYDALNPAVAYDRANNEYLVVWQDDEMGVGEFEIWGQRVAGYTGWSVESDTRLSDMGPEGDANFDAQTPALAYSGTSNNQYLVVWSGDNSTDGEFEIWGQRFTGGRKIYLPVVVRNH